MKGVAFFHLSLDKFFKPPSLPPISKRDGQQLNLCFKWCSWIISRPEDLSQRRRRDVEVGSQRLPQSWWTQASSKAILGSTESYRQQLFRWERMTFISGTWNLTSIHRAFWNHTWVRTSNLPRERGWKSLQSALLAFKKVPYRTWNSP